MKEDAFATGTPNLIQLAGDLGLHECVTRMKEVGLDRVLNHEGELVLSKNKATHIVYCLLTDVVQPFIRFFWIYIHAFIMIVEILNCFIGWFTLFCPTDEAFKQGNILPGDETLVQKMRLHVARGNTYF